MQEWLENFYIPDTRENIRHKLLILDSYAVHKNYLSRLEINNTHVLFIPSHLTPFLQPLGTSKVNFNN